MNSYPYAKYRFSPYLSGVEVRLEAERQALLDYSNSRISAEKSLNHVSDHLWSVVKMS